MSVEQLNLIQLTEIVTVIRYTGIFALYCVFAWFMISAIIFCICEFKDFNFIKGAR